MRIRLIALTAVLLALIGAASPAQASKKTVIGSEGQRLMATQTTGLKDGQIVKVTGTKYNKKVGIYVAFCELPKQGKLPTNCAGGVNIDAESSSSFWISDNPPEYAQGLTKKFTTRGGFIVNLKVSRYIGKTDCAVKKCAILTRADHTRTAYRKADVVIPVSFKK